MSSYRSSPKRVHSPCERKAPSRALDLQVWQTKSRVVFCQVFLSHSTPTPLHPSSTRYLTQVYGAPKVCGIAFCSQQVPSRFLSLYYIIHQRPLAACIDYCSTFGWVLCLLHKWDLSLEGPNYCMEYCTHLHEFSVSSFCSKFHHALLCLFKALQ